MEFLEDDYILALWFAQRNDLGNWVCTIKKASEPKSWFCEIRYRYFQEGQDEKNAYELTLKNKTEEEVISQMNEAFEDVKNVYTDKSEILFIRGGAKKFMELSKNASFIHANKKAINGQIYAIN
jgi:hypothetical protein